MPEGWTVAVHDTFGVRLSNEVVCDGFLREARTRVQTHIHRDHRQGFDSCKGAGRKIVALPGTRDLMIAEADDLLARRDNFIPLDPGEEFEVEGGKIQLFENHHMLGSAQVLFESIDGYRTGYSGDFGWPCTPIEVDELVVDGTSAPRTRGVRQPLARSSALEHVEEPCAGDARGARRPERRSRRHRA